MTGTQRPVDQQLDDAHVHSGQPADERVAETRRGVRPTSLREDVRRLPVTSRRFVTEAVIINVVEPVQEGRISFADRSPATRAVLWWAIAAYVLAVGLVLFGGAARATFALTAAGGASTVLSLPRDLLWAVVFLLVLSLTLVQTGALHTPRWLRFSMLVTTSMALLLIGSTDTRDLGEGIAGLSLGMATAVVMCLVLVGLQVVRWRHDPIWWEFVVVLVAVTTTVVVAFATARSDAVSFGTDIAPLNTTLVLTTLRNLAIPVTVVAGVAVADLGLTAVTWASDFVQQRCSSSLLAVGVACLGAVRGRDVVRRVVAGDVSGRQLAGTVVLSVVVVAGWFVLDRLADRVSSEAAGNGTDDEDGAAPSDSSTVLDLTGALGTVALPVAVALTAVFIPFTLVSIASQVVFSVRPSWQLSTDLIDLGNRLGSDSALLITRVVAGLAMLVAAVVLARRARRGASELLGVIGIMLVGAAAVRPGAIFDGWGWTDETLDLVAVVVVGATALVGAVRRRLSAHLAEVLLLLFVTGLLTSRDFVSDPLSSLLGFAGVGFVLFGFVWTFLSGAGDTSDSSARYPRDARLLLFVAQSLFGVTLLAWTALVRSVEQGGDLDSFSVLGDELVGVPLLVAAFVALAASLARSLRSPRSSDGQVGRD